MLTKQTAGCTKFPGGFLYFGFLWQGQCAPVIDFSPVDIHRLTESCDVYRRVAPTQMKVEQHGAAMSISVSQAACVLPRSLSGRKVTNDELLTLARSGLS